MVIPAFSAIRKELGSNSEAEPLEPKVPIARSLARSSPKALSELVLRESVNVSMCSLSKTLIPVPLSIDSRRVVRVSICSSIVLLGISLERGLKGFSISPYSKLGLIYLI